MESRRYSRRSFLGVAAGTAATLARRPERAAAALRRIDLQTGGSAAYATAPNWHVPQIVTERFAADTAPGLIFLAPFGSQVNVPGSVGPLIVDDEGEPVWFLPLLQESAWNFRPQRYRGQAVLTWYESTAGAPYGGTCVIYDPSYRALTRVRGGHGYACDGHEFLITSRDTALLAIANDVRCDLTAVGGPADAVVVEGIVQELDIESGKVLFEWHSLDHVAPEESFRTAVTDAGNVDYFHLNSIGVAPDGNLIVSARHTSTVYKLDRRNGAILWRLGGKRSDFAIGPGANFEFQHDARAHDDGSLTLFDNGATDAGAGDVEPASRPLRLRVDEAGMTAELVQAYVPPTPRLATAMGDVQVLPDGTVFVGWGTAGGFTEFAPDGTVRLDARFADDSISYRAFRSPWAGRPDVEPAVVLGRTTAGKLQVHASWNGATDVAFWEVQTGAVSGELKASATVPRSGFETVIEVPPANYLTVVALDESRRRLGRSTAIRSTN